MMVTAQFSTVDDGKHSQYICIFCLHILYTLSIHSSTKRNVRKTAMDSFEMGIILFRSYVDIHLYRRFSSH